MIKTVISIQLKKKLCFIVFFQKSKHFFWINNKFYLGIKQFKRQLTKEEKVYL